MIETSQLQTLLSVSRAMSFSKAAEDMHVTQSAISQSIKNLENKLGVKLFKRAGKNIVLTPEGEKLSLFARDFLQKLNDTLDDIHYHKDSMAGNIRIGTLTGVGKSWLGSEMLVFAKDYPELKLSITLASQEELVAQFEKYNLDFIVVPEDTLPHNGEKKFLGEESCTLVYPKGSQFQWSPDITLEEFASFPTVFFEGGDGLYSRWCLQHFGRIPRNTNIRLSVNSHGNMMRAVQMGLGVAVIPKHVLYSSFYKDKLSFLGPEYDVSNGKFYLVYHKEALELLRIRKTLEWIESMDNPFESRS
jgi:DNA-binding transcriptional LysR family regulator